MKKYIFGLVLSCFAAGSFAAGSMVRIDAERNTTSYVNGDALISVFTQPNTRQKGATDYLLVLKYTDRVVTLKLPNEAAANQLTERFMNSEPKVLIDTSRYNTLN